MLANGTQKKNESCVNKKKFKLKILYTKRNKSKPDLQILLMLCSVKKKNWSQFTVSKSHS